MATYDAGIVTAYGAAVRGGYIGTYEQYCTEQAHIGTNAQRAETAAQAAEEAATSIPLIAPDYYNTATYKVGDYVKHEGYVWRCLSDISTPEEWNTFHWSTVIPTNELNGAVNNYADAIGANQSHSVGDYCIYRLDRYPALFRCINAYTGGWISGNWEQVKVGNELSDLKDGFGNIGLSVVDGKLSITYEEVTA